MPGRGRLTGLGLGLASLIFVVTVAAANTSTNTDPTPDDKKGLSTDGLAGVIVGAISAVIALVGLFTQKKSLRAGFRKLFSKNKPPLPTHAGGPMPAAASAMTATQAAPVTMANGTTNPTPATPPFQTRVRHFFRASKVTLVPTPSTSTSMGASSTSQPPAAMASPPPTAVSRPPAPAPSSSSTPPRSTPGLPAAAAPSADLVNLRENWLARARRRRNDRKDSTEYDIKYGLRWELVEAGEPLPSDALHYEIGDPNPLYIARAVAWHKKHQRPEMVVNGMCKDKKTDALRSQNLETWSETPMLVEPPYEVLCGPEGAAVFSYTRNEFSPSYVPAMLLAEDSLGDYPIVSIIVEARSTEWMRDTMEAHQIKLRLSPRAATLNLSPGFVVRDPGLLVLGDLPCVQGRPKVTKEIVDYEADGGTISFPYEAGGS